MARVTIVKGRSAPWLLRLMNWYSRTRTGKEMEPLGVVAHNPRFLLPFAMTSELIGGKTRLDRRIRTLCTELASHINGCSWCVDYGRALALRQRVPADKLDALEQYATSPLFNPAERAALALAEGMIRDVYVPDSLWDEARHYFDERELVELVVAVAIETFYNRVNAALGIESQGYCELPSLLHNSHAKVSA